MTYQNDTTSSSSIRPPSTIYQSSSIRRTTSRPNSTYHHPTDSHTITIDPTTTSTTVIELDDLTTEGGLTNLPRLQPYTNQLPQLMKLELIKFWSHRQHPYTKIGTKTLIVSSNHKNNDHRQLDEEEEEELHQRYTELGYGNVTGELRDQELELRPHLYELATTAYLHLRRMGEDQTILFSGMTGSGKTHSYHLCLKHLTYLGNFRTRGGSGLNSQPLLQAHRVLRWVGQASTKWNLQASRLGLYQELQYDTKGRLRGFKSLGYYLEDSRVTTSHTTRGESNFHAFYWLLENKANLDDTELLRLGLTLDPQQYHYTRLNHLKPRVVSEQIRHLESGHESKLGIDSALKTIGIRRKARHHIYQLLAIILHLGNLEWTESDSKLIIRDANLLDIIGELCGVPSDSLESILTTRTRCIGGELCTMILKLDETYRQRDQLARTLYHLLFSWIVEAINSKCHHHPTNEEEDPIYFISLLDQPGFLPLTPNLKSDSGDHHGYEPMLDEFAINFINECLQDFVIDHHLSSDGGIHLEMTQAGLSTPEFQLFPSPKTTLHLLRGDHSQEPATRQGCIPLLEALTLEHQHHPRRNGMHQADSNERLSWVQPGKHTAWEILGHFADHPSFVPPTATLNQNTHQKNRKSITTSDNNDQQFTIQHFWGPVTYYTEKTMSSHDDYRQYFLDDNGDSIPPDAVNLFRNQCENPFLKDLFFHPLLTGQCHQGNQTSMILARLPRQSILLPTDKHRSFNPYEDPSVGKPIFTSDSKLGQLNHSVEGILNTLRESNLRRVIHLRRSLNYHQKELQPSLFEWQLQHHHILPLIQSSRPDWVISFTMDELLDRYQSIFPILIPRRKKMIPADPLTRVHEFIRSKGWGDEECLLSQDKIFLTEFTWKELEDSLRRSELATRSVTKLNQASYDSDHTASGLNLNFSSSDPMVHTEGISQQYPFDYQSRYNGNYVGGGQPITSSNSHYHLNDSFLTTSIPSETSSDEGLRGLWRGPTRESVWSPPHHPITPTSYYQPTGSYETLINVTGPKSQSTPYPRDKEQEPIISASAIPSTPSSPSRKLWKFITRLTTLLIPNGCLKCRGMKDSSSRVAWREKVTIFLLFIILWGGILFLFTGLAPLICPNSEDFSLGDLRRHRNLKDNYVAIKGVIYDITRFSQSDHGGGSGVSAGPDEMLELAGQDITDSFPINLKSACPELIEESDLQLRNNQSDYSGYVHKVDPTTDYAENSRLLRPNWFYEVALPGLKLMKRGHLSYTWDELESGIKRGVKWGMIDNEIFNLSPLFQTIDALGDAKAGPYHFLHDSIESLFHQNKQPADLTTQWSKLKLTTNEKKLQLQCMKNLFYVGRIDLKPTARCIVTDYVLFTAAWVMSLMMLMKLLSSGMRLRSNKTLNQISKFVICHVPCYTEGEATLRQSLESVACLDYPDKYKLLFIVTDGMIIGSGNDQPTANIILDILGVDQMADDPLPQSFLSLGVGSRQHNMGKVYSGLYNHAGHQIPFLFVSKVGTSDEQVRPGNRGKRDSQVLLMRFLNRAHNDMAMSPLELQLYYHLNDVIGVNPTRYEYLLMVEPQTQIAADALTRLVTCMSRDPKIAGMTGEVHLTNPRDTWVTRLQSYDRFVSHYLTLPFESLFNSVTCLPSSFSCYRIWTPSKPVDKLSPVVGRPVIIHDSVLQAFSENHVVTSHQQHLLNANEDRYLTTLIMKNFPGAKLRFAAGVKSWVPAPTLPWSTYLLHHQRSTHSQLHNLMELLTFRHWCNFCCLSFRSVILTHLLTALLTPALYLYTTYLIYVTIYHPYSLLTLVTTITLIGTHLIQLLLFLVTGNGTHALLFLLKTFTWPYWYLWLPLLTLWRGDKLLLTSPSFSRPSPTSPRYQPLPLPLTSSTLTLSHRPTSTAVPIPLRPWSQYQPPPSPPSPPAHHLSYHPSYPLSSYHSNSYYHPQN